MNLLKIAFFFALSFFVQNPIHAQEWVSYQSEQRVNDLVDTGNELLMATDAGLVVMNKSTLDKTIFNKGNSDLSSNHIQTITQSVDGVTWIGTYDVILARFDGNGFAEIIVPESDEINQYTELYDFKIAPNGDFWLGTSDGVLQRSGETWFHYDEEELGDSFFEAWDIEINAEGEVFVGSVHIHKFADGVWSNITDTTQLLGYLDASLFFSKSGDLYFGGDLDRIGRFDGTQWHEDDLDVDLNGSQVLEFTEDIDGNVYLNTQYDGIFKLVNDTWIQQVDDQTGAFDNNTSYFYIDEQNNRWLNNGIHLSVNNDGDIQSTTISNYTLEYNNITKVRKGANGHLYFISNYSNSVISILDNEDNWSLLSLPSTMPFENFTDILFLADNDIWLSSSNGIYHYDGNEWILTETSGSGFAVDTQGKIYVRSVDKISIIDNGIVSEYNVDNSPISTLIISGHGVDANDNLWISSFSWEEEDMIQKVATDGTWTTYTDIDHPAIDRRPNGDIHFDKDGNVWVPLDIGGAAKFDGTTWTNPLLDNIALIENASVHSIESDATGKLYFAHQYGVTTLFNDEWEDLIVEDVPLNFSHDSDIVFDDEGTLWWASSRYGVFSYTPENTTATFSEFEKANNFSIYPNPVKTFTNIDFTIEESASVKAFIYNNLGQLQSRLDLGQFSVGTFQQRINFAHFPKGFYTIQLEINGQVSAKTIVVQ